MKKKLTKTKLTTDTRELIKTYNSSVLKMRKIKCPIALTEAINIVTEGTIQLKEKVTFLRLSEFLENEVERIGLDALRAKLTQCYIDVKRELYELTFLKYTAKEMLLIGTQALMFVHFLINIFLVTYFY